MISFISYSWMAPKYLRSVLNHIHNVYGMKIFNCHSTKIVLCTSSAADAHIQPTVDPNTKVIRERTKVILSYNTWIYTHIVLNNMYFPKKRIVADTFWVQTLYIWSSGGSLLDTALIALEKLQKWKCKCSYFNFPMLTHITSYCKFHCYSLISFSNGNT